MATWSALPVEMRAAVLAYINSVHDFVACMTASASFYEATTDTQRRMWRYTPDQRKPPNVFDTDEPIEVMAAVWSRWAHRLDLDYEQILRGPAQSGRLDVIRFACTIAGLAGGARPTGPCLCPRWHKCACGDPKQVGMMRHEACRDALYAAAASGHTDAVLYLINNTTAAPADLRPHALDAAARYAQIHVVEALAVDPMLDQETITRMVDDALNFEQPKMVFWLHDRGWLSADAVAPYLEWMVLVAAACACAPEFESTWRLLSSRKPGSIRRLWRAAMLKAGSRGNVGVLGWLLDNPPDPDASSSSSGANVASHALLAAIEHGHLDAANLLRGRGAKVSLPMFQCALRQATTNGYADSVVPICVSFYDAAFMEGGYRLVECACAVDHVGLLGFAIERFGAHLALHARRSLGTDKNGAALLWLDKYFPN
ncbi:hypothetical protein psal_cds_891 [Pandoravirus salinus]|uniref:Ankyrin repeat domain containing protein n=1 Tax=Pandoravirus salinus TaxID=1349410 RepID=S4W3W8_9VIRU|nr:hypothetical protein psal_cds_891 [Pandoravirus salinus]AGO84980.1 hypothetical protein psal_cds_891 [Pandoravirus salinus]